MVLELSGAVILAAGKGKRMKTETPKVLNRICGKYMVDHVLEAVSRLTSHIVLVIGYKSDTVKNELGDNFKYAYQLEQKGTGHAVLQALPHLPSSGMVLITCGDTPLLSAASLETLIKESRKGDAGLLTAEVPNPGGYGRVIRGENKQITAIVEEAQADNEVKKIREINTGTYCINVELLKKLLPQITPDQETGEYYLTDIVHLMVEQGYYIVPCRLDDYRESLGVNNLKQLAEVENIMRKNMLSQLMLSGVKVLDPDSTYIDAGVSVGSGTVIYPNTVIEGASSLGENCNIGPSVHLKEVKAGPGVEIRFTVAEETEIGEKSVIGPFVYLRPGTRLGTGVKIGDFVEVKNSNLENYTKVPHLSYVGDADIGEGVNFGAGSIVVNYDGRKKHRTTVQEGAFIGCNSNLIAPLVIGRGAYVAAGSTLNQDVPENALAIARSPQETKPGLAKRFIKK